MEHDSWRAIAAELGIHIISPFDLEIDGTRATFAALLPQFGGSLGMIVDAEWLVIEPHVDALLRQGYGFSCISIDGGTLRDMQDVLLDWGWNGSTLKKPEWPSASPMPTNLLSTPPPRFAPGI